MQCTIIKVKHDNVNEARRIVPYIKECNVLAPESAYLTVAHAERIESTWEGLLQKSRSHLKKHMQRLRDTSMPPNSLDFPARTYEYAHRNSCLLWHVERWPEEDAAYFLQRSNVMCSNRAEAFSYLSKGIVNLFLKCFRAVLCSCFEDSIVRDRHIGEMINMSEERICNRFPNLKEGVNLCVYIGGSHFPEQHTDIQVKIIDLVDSKDIVGKIMCAYGRREEKTVTDLDLVRSAFCSAFPRDSRVLSGQVGTMDIAEIVKEITALQKREKSGVSAFEQVKY